MPTLRTKTLALVAASIGLAQIVVGAVNIWQETNRYAVMKRDTLVGAAQMLGAAAADAVAHGDAARARAALRAVGRIPGLAFVGVEDRTGRALADLGAVEQLDSDVRLDAGKGVSPLALWRTRTVEAAAPIVDQGVEVGRIRLVADVADLPGRLWQSALASLIGALAALGIALAIALRWLGALTRPLAALASAMDGVRARHDYSIAMAPTRRNDEIGALVNGFNAMIGDIRERDARLAAHRDQLEADVAARTADYRVAMEAAEEANSAKSDFLATMSHEIRTPMNGVLAMADLLAAAELPPRARRYADVIARSGRSLVAIINDILDFSKIEAGKLEVESLEVELVGCVESCVALFGERAAGKQLDLAYHISADAGRAVIADPTRLAQVLSNLVNNALKFTERGDVRVWVTRDRDDASRVRFAVTDTGVGIPADKLDHIFSAFSQSDQTTTRRFGGTGLGLSIARRLTQAMGGDIRVASTPGQGSTFFFSLPAADAAPVAASALHGRAIIAIAGDATRDAALASCAEAGLEAVACAPEALLDIAHADAGAVIADLAALNGLARRPGGELTRVIGVCAAGAVPDDLNAQGRADAVFERPLAHADLALLFDAMRGGAALALTSRRRESPGAAPDFAGARVLVVDDGAVNREVAQEALRQLGARVELAEDGRQALAILARERFDLVLMDGSMPEMDGFEATRRIRAGEAGEDATRMPVVALTAHVVGAAAQAWRAAGMDGVLHKPFTLRSLADCLRAHLPARLAAGQAQAMANEAAPVATATENDDLPVITAESLAQLRALSQAGRADFVQRVTALYAEHAPPTLTTLREAGARADAATAASAAHALKSMSLNLGAAQVARLAGQIEADARERGTAPDDARCSELETLVAQARDALRATFADAAREDRAGDEKRAPEHLLEGARQRS